VSSYNSAMIRVSHDGPPTRHLNNGDRARIVPLHLTSHKCPSHYTEQY
jgi:hypothetical protein